MLFTFLYQHHFTSLSHSSTIVTLCRSLRVTNSNGIPLPLQSTCHEASAQLGAAPTVLQTFLSVTKDIVLGGGDYAKIRTDRNLKVLRFVALKMVGLGLFFGCASRSSRSTNASRAQLEAGQEDGRFEVVIEAEHCVKGLLSTDPPAYSPRRIENDADLEEEDSPEEDDLPWIVLALSLIGHLAVVLFDQGAFASLAGSGVCRDKWVVIGAALFVVGMLGIWREHSSKPKIRLEEPSIAEESRDAKRDVVVVVSTEIADLPLSTR